MLDRQHNRSTAQRFAGAVFERLCEPLQASAHIIEAANGRIQPHVNASKRTVQQAATTRRHPRASDPRARPGRRGAASASCLARGTRQRGALSVAAPESASGALLSLELPGKKVSPN